MFNKYYVVKNATYKRKDLENKQKGFGKETEKIKKEN